jgi:hypothetical protein
MSIEEFSDRRNAAPPSRLGQRYEPGRFLPEAGNTVVCPLGVTDPAHKAVLAARAQMQTLPGADRLLFTPEKSLHMTLFEGVIETRRTEDAWPSGLDREAPVDEVTEVLAKRLEGCEFPSAFRVKATGLRPVGLALEGATDADQKLMLEWREALTRPFGYRHRDHDSYRFHMTFAYPLAWLPDDLIPVWRNGLAVILNELQQAAPIIPLSPPAFCTFADMTDFPERLALV